MHPYLSPGGRGLTSFCPCCAYPHVPFPGGSTSSGSSGSPRWGGGGTKCTVCTKTVYKLEEFILDGASMHKKCFKCDHCKRQVEARAHTHTHTHTHPITTVAHHAHKHSLICTIVSSNLGCILLSLFFFSSLISVCVCANAHPSVDDLELCGCEREDVLQDTLH